MVLPKAVQAELEAAAQIEQQLAGVAEPQQTEPAPEVTPEQVAEPEVVPAAPEPEVRVPDWEQKYRTLQSKYDVEVPRLHREVRETNAKLQQLVQELEAAKATPQKQDAAPVPVSEQDREAFGDDLVNLQERIARAVAAPLEQTIQKLTERLGKYESTAEVVASQQAATAEDRYFERLAAQVPNWEQVNGDAKWVEWLSGRYPGMAMTRQEQLNAARSALNLETTVELFRAFEELTQKPKSTNSQALNSQVAPPKSKQSSTPVSDASTRIWTQAEVAAALDPRKLRGMSADQVAQVMSEIDAAAAEGRVKP